METRIKLLILALIWVSTSNVYAQRCADNYSALDEACIRSKDSLLKETSIEVTKALTNNVYFYRSNLGNPGKLKIISVVTDKERTAQEKKNGFRECVVYFEASTFVKGKPFTPNASTLNIKAEYNIWQQDSVGLDQNGPYDLRLEREGDKCLLKSAGAKWVFYKKMDEDSFEGTGSPILYWTSLFLIGLAVFLVARATVEEENKFKASET